MNLLKKCLNKIIKVIDKVICHNGKFIYIIYIQTNWLKCDNNKKMRTCAFWLSGVY